MEEIALFINDLGVSAHLEKDLSMITFDPDHHVLHIVYAWSGPNGVGDHEEETCELANGISLSELFETVDELFDHIVSLDDFLYNDGLIDYYLQENNPRHLKEIDELYIAMLTRDYKRKESEDDYVDLAVGMQLYGHFLETYDFARCSDAYMREKDLLEDVAAHHPTQENLQNAVVGYQDIIRVYEKLGDDFAEDLLQLYLSLYVARKRFDETYDYDLGHICERIGILYNDIDTQEDMDEIDNDAKRIRLSIRYHLEEKEIFASVYKESGENDDAYNYGIALRQLGLRYESLGTEKDLNQAADYFQQAFDVFSKLYDESEKYRDTYIIAVEHLGNIAFDLKNYTQALGYYMEVEADEMDSANSGLAEDLFSVAVIAKKLGRTFSRMGYFDEALRAFEKSLDYVLKTLEKADDYAYRAEEGIAYMNLGWLYMDRDPKQALTYFKKDYELRVALYEEFHNITSHYSLSLAQRHLGYVYEALRKNDEALKYLKRCYDISYHYASKHHQEGETHYLAVSAYDLGHCLMLNHQDEEALKYIEEALDYLTHVKEYVPHEYPLDLDDVKHDEKLLKERLDDKVSTD